MIQTIPPQLSEKHVLKSARHAIAIQPVAPPSMPAEKNVIPRTAMHSAMPTVPSMSGSLRPTRSTIRSITTVTTTVNRPSPALARMAAEFA